MAKKQQEKDPQDSPWKRILRQYFPEAIEFFFPEIAKTIDWTKPIEFLDKEFLKIAPDAATGNRHADQLVKVYLKEGKAIFLLLHIEIQASYEARFTKRIFTYNIRIFDYFDQVPTSLVILCDTNPKWRPHKFGASPPGTTMAFEFSTVKLLDYGDRIEELKQSPNPFAWVVVAHLKLQETKQDKVSRKDWKLRLFQELYESGYNQEVIANVCNFIDWLLNLPKPLENQFRRELKIYEEERKMPYGYTIERIGYDRGQVVGRQEGHQEGRVEGRVEVIIDQLDYKFGSIPPEINDQISALSLEQLSALSRGLLGFGSIEDLKTWLANSKAD
jgi:hypothetical protein